MDPNTSWLRFRGRGKRGAPSVATDDIADIDLAIRELQAGRDALRDAYRIPSDAGRGVRKRAIKDALAKIALGTRFADAVVMRRGGICGDVLDDDDDT